MAVEGTLDAFALPDVLRLLATTAKTGWLSVDGDRGQGTLEVLEGWLVGARSDGAPEASPAPEILFDLLRFAQGSFRFSGEEPSSEVNEDPLEINAVLDRAMELLEEWRDLEAIVPSPDHLVGLTDELDADQVTIDARLWPALAAAAMKATAGELGATLGLGELATARLVRDLVELGVVFVEPPYRRPSERTPPARRPVAAARRAPSVAAPPA